MFQLACKPDAAERWIKSNANKWGAYVAGLDLLVKMIANLCRPTSEAPATKQTAVLFGLAALDANRRPLKLGSYKIRDWHVTPIYWCRRALCRAIDTQFIQDSLPRLSPHHRSTRFWFVVKFNARTTIATKLPEPQPNPVILEYGLVFPHKINMTASPPPFKKEFLSWLIIF